MQAASEPENALVATLRRRIAERGPISFAEFMRAALYDPQHGYYTSGRPVWGADGDYVTAPGVHSAYGAAVARLATEVDQALGEPPRFDLVEIGAGDGTLLRTALAELRATRPQLWRRTRAGMVERGTPSRTRAVHDLTPPGAGLWDDDDLAAAGPLRGLLFCNELLDAFAVERVRVCDGELEQSRIGVQDGRLVERFASPVDDAIVRHLEAVRVRLREGQVAEVCLEVGPWLQRVVTALEAGALLVVDYGHETATLYGPERDRGTLVSMHRYRLGDDPLEDPGRRDLTAHVDLGNLRRLGRDRGLVVQGPCSLRVFLLGMGAAERRPDDARERLGLRHLLVSEIGDRHQAMLLSRGLPGRVPLFGRARLETEQATAPAEE